MDRLPEKRQGERIEVHTLGQEHHGRAVDPPEMPAEIATGNETGPVAPQVGLPAIEAHACGCRQLGPRRAVALVVRLRSEAGDLVLAVADTHQDHGPGLRPAGGARFEVVPKGCEHHFAELVPWGEGMVMNYVLLEHGRLPA